MRDVPHLADQACASRLETPATDAGWTVEQSRKNFDVVTKLVNTAAPATSRLLLKPLDPSAGGMGHTGGSFWTSRTDPEYLALLKWIQSLPADRYVAEGRSAARLRLLPRLRAAGVRHSTRRPHQVQQLPRGRPRSGSRRSRRTARRGATQEAKRAFSTDLAVDHPRQSRAEPLPAEAAASRWRRLLHAQRSAALAVAERSGVADARRLGPRRAQREHLLVACRLAGSSTLRRRTRGRSAIRSARSYPLVRSPFARSTSKRPTSTRKPAARNWSRRRRNTSTLSGTPRSHGMEMRSCKSRWAPRTHHPEPRACFQEPFALPIPLSACRCASRR